MEVIDNMVHELDSPMLFIHPPIALAGYLLIIIVLIQILRLMQRSFERTELSSGGLAKEMDRLASFSSLSWALNFLSLVTGMIWAQMAWGAYWSWDPKETATLILFLFVTLTHMAILALDNKAKALLSQDKKEKDLSSDDADEKGNIIKTLDSRYMFLPLVFSIATICMIFITIAISRVFGGLHVF